MCKINKIVSIVIPVYNVEEYLSECIESVLEQTYPCLEIFLVDDGSTDNSGKICDCYAEKDSRIKVIHQVNAGVSHARNIALDKVTGEYLIFVDSDDIINPHLVEICLDTMQKSNVDMVIYPYQKFYVKEELLPVTYCDCDEEIEKLFMDQDMLLNEVFKGENGSQRFRMLACNKMYDTKLFSDVRFPEKRKYGEDASVTYRILKKVEKAVWLEHTELYYYRFNPNSALNKKISKDNLQLFVTYNEIYADIKKNMTKHISLITYAYVVRIFDFIVRIAKELENKDEQNLYLQCLKEIVEIRLKDILKCPFISIYQKLLMSIFWINRKMFRKIYKAF